MIPMGKTALTEIYDRCTVRIRRWTPHSTMTSRMQKLALLAHITFSVGWFGAVAAYLALAIAALTSHDEQIVRAACLSMKLIGWFVIVPFSFAALLSGFVQSLGTRWGLFRYWWIVAKLVLTVFAVVVLLQHMRNVDRLSLLAKEPASPLAALRPELIHSAGGLLVLFAAMTLSVFKPWGVTPHGQRRLLKVETASHSNVVPMREPVFHGRRASWARIIGYHAIGLLALFVILHVTGFHHH